MQRYTIGVTVPVPRFPPSNAGGERVGVRSQQECVEEEAILGILREIGVDYAQGYTVGRPRALAELM